VFHNVFHNCELLKILTLLSFFHSFKRRNPIKKQPLQRRCLNTERSKRVLVSFRFIPQICCVVLRTPKYFL
ncbi:MAG: hypothetical protein D6714_09045, partial [Bacteroidetes bacterium]